MQKAISSIMPTLLLVLITIASVIFLYAFTTNYMNSSEPAPIRLASSLKIDGVEIIRANDGSTLIYVWVRKHR